METELAEYSVLIKVVQITIIPKATRVNLTIKYILLENLFMESLPDKK